LICKADAFGASGAFHKVVGNWRGLVRFKWLLPAVLSTTAGAVDVIGFLTLDGLFTAHITGNLVMLAAHYVPGGFSQLGPLLAVPVFIAMVILVTLLFGAADVRASRRVLLVLHAALWHASCLTRKRSYRICTRPILACGSTLQHTGVS
jgi:uncharacterized membrane protein YoaK (UPF0700 family)